jgi:hypothetical protein
MTGVGGYWSPSQTYPSKTILTRTDALPATDADDRAVANPAQGIPVSQLRKLDTSGMNIIAAKDVPELRDMIATAWLRTQAAAKQAAVTDVPDNAPQNIYATIEVGGKVVATLYNGGSCAMTNAAAATAGDLPDSPGGGPDLAQSRAEYIAKAVGGTIRKASTAITQSQWTPRQSVSQNYTRAQLDAAFESAMQESEKAAAQRAAGYPAAPPASGFYADFSA